MYYFFLHFCSLFFLGDADLFFSLYPPVRQFFCFYFFRAFLLVLLQPSIFSSSALCFRPYSMEEGARCARKDLRGT